MEKNKIRILIVEDEAIVAADLQQQLAALGYGVASIAHSGEECLRLAAESEYDLVLMDINLAGTMDGLEAASELRATRDIPIIFLTALADPATLERAKASEPHGYLVKPFDPRELRATIEMALFKHAAERERQQLLAELQDALAKVKTLGGLLPICCCCKKIRDDAGYWSQVEVFVQKHTDATFSHSFCPECAQTMIAQRH